MKFKSSTFRKIVSIILSFAVILPSSLFLIGDSGKAEAAISLPYIEEIKQDGGAYKILEIVPNASQGSLGYLFNGLEPCSNWMTMSAQQTSTAARKTYVDTLISNLTSAGIASTTTDGAPLKINGSYVEKYPWDDHTGYSQMTLDHWETVNVSGKMKQETGDFTPYYTYALVGSGGSYVQVISGLNPGTTTTQNSYYYNINFEKLTEFSVITEGSLIYAKTIGTADLSTIIGGTVIDLRCLGVYGSSDFQGIDIGDETYIAKPVGSPQTTLDSSHPFLAVGDEFRAASSGESGYFRQDLLAYKYVGSGNGSYSFKSNNGNKKDCSLMSNVVYYTGGYTNNSWFLRYVFDWTSNSETKPDINFIIDTVTGNSVIADDISQYDLIILTNGVALSGVVTTFPSSDISDAVKDKIIDVNSNLETPIIVDSGLVGGSLKINSLASTLLNSSNTPRVTRNIYCAQYPIASTGFITSFTASKYNTANSPFFLVYKEIQDENLLRSINGITNLSETVNPATAVRYIINTLEGRNNDAKTVISVLDIEPGDAASLTGNAVLSWLGNPTGVKAEIDNISTAEFIGKIDELSDKYDLIYIGSNLTGFNTTTNSFGETIPKYNDSTMDGLVYTNIGDTVVSGGDSGFSISGLLDRDYTSDTYTYNGNTYNYLRTGTSSNYDNTARTFRYSGNDLTKSKMEQLEAFANAGHPIIVANNLAHGIGAVSNSTYTTGLINYANKGYCIYKPTISYADSSSQKLSVSLETVSSYGSYTNTNNAYVSSATCSLWKCNSGSSSYTLVLSQSINSTTSPTFDLSTGSSGDKYYCVINVSQVKARNRTYSISSSQINSVGKTEAREIKAVNDYCVDNSSYMYQLLQDTLSKPNVMSVTEAICDSVTALNYVNVPTPEIVFSTVSSTPVYPTVYKKYDDGTTDSLTAKADGSYYLEYRFMIENDSDPTPASTNYYCNLFIDGNGDGRYSDNTTGPNELLSDIIIRQWDSATNKAGSLVANGELKAGIEYYVSRKLPSDKIGLVPWKLKIITNSSNGTYTSYHNYTHIAVPKDLSGNTITEEIPTIEVLQVNTSRTETSFWGTTTSYSGLSLESQMTTVSSGSYYSSVTKKYYTGIYGKLIADISNDNKIAIKTVKANVLDSSSTWSHNGTTYTSLEAFLNSFDMIIIGFDDCYQELSLASANAIVGFIDTGKATLFTHDNTSFFFLPFKAYRAENYGSLFVYPWYAYSNLTITNYLFPNYNMFGYNFNMTIRDKVGLDRYGVTNTTYGLTEKSIPSIRTVSGGNGSGIVASTNNTSIAGTANETNLLKDGYSIAYKPRSDRTKTVGETQGLTKGILMRYYQGGGTPSSDTYQTSFETTSTISQVNEGQITTYPFNVNTEKFKTDSTVNSMSIATTHFQYDQLNMNSDDIVVWYCLSGGTFDYLSNDVINAYYAYSRGNVTYSGCGHTTDSINKNEAKLFVNTMIAACRVAQTAPKVSITDSTGIKPLNNFLVPSDSYGVLSASNSKNIYFIVDDTNIGDKIITASFTYTQKTLNGDTSKILSGIKIYNKETGKEIPSGQSLTSGILYYAEFNEIYKAINSSDSEYFNNNIDNGITVNLTVTSTFNGTSINGSDCITLRQYSLNSLG